MPVSKKLYSGITSLPVSEVKSESHPLHSIDGMRSDERGGADQKRVVEVAKLTTDEQSRCVTLQWCLLVQHRRWPSGIHSQHTNMTYTH